MLASCFAQGACMCFVRGGLHIHSLHMLAQGVCLFLLRALLRGPTMCFAQGGLHVLCSVRPENALLKRSCICLLRGHACALLRGELYVPGPGGGGMQVLLHALPLLICTTLHPNVCQEDKKTPATVHLQNSGGFLPQEMCLVGFCRRKCMGGGQHLENSPCRKP